MITFRKKFCRVQDIIDEFFAELSSVVLSLSSAV